MGQVLRCVFHQHNSDMLQQLESKAKGHPLLNRQLAESSLGEGSAMQCYVLVSSWHCIRLSLSPFYDIHSFLAC